MMKPLNHLFNWIIYSNIFVAFCVLALAMSSELIFDSSNLKVNLFVFFATVFTYNFQRVVKANQRKEAVNYDWFAKHKISTYSLMLISGIIAAYLFYFFQLDTQILITLSSIICILYPFVLRNIPYAKIFIISFIWTISSMLLLIVENDIILSQNIYMHLLSRFLFVFAITIPFDIRDLKYDESSIRTIPVIFGEVKSKWIAVLALILALLIILVQLIHFDMPIHFLIAMLCLFLLASLFIINSSENKSAIYYCFWVESMSVFCYLFLILSTLLI